MFFTGPLLVAGALQLMTLASMLTIGIHLAPGVGFLVIAAVIILIDRHRHVCGAHEVGAG